MTPTPSDVLPSAPARRWLPADVPADHQHRRIGRRSLLGTGAFFVIVVPCMQIAITYLVIAVTCMQIAITYLVP
jgi:hypothetical protein